MVTITPSALEELKRIRESNDFEPQQCLRLAIVAPQTLGLVLDEAGEEDQVEELAGVRVLLVSPDIGQALDGASFDFESSEEGKGFRLVPPEGACDCEHQHAHGEGCEHCD